MTGRNPFHQSLKRHLLLGLAAVLVVGGIIFGWATLTEISGVVIAQGKLVVDSNVKKVQLSIPRTSSGLA